MEERQSHVTMTSQFRRSGEDEGAQEHTQETLEVFRFPDGVSPAEVRFGLGMTLNVGNFETVRVDVGVTVPCLREEVEEAFSYAERFVGERIQSARDRVRGGARTKVLDEPF